MKLLTRYLIRHNFFLLFTILLVGCGLYILTDLFERLDNFLESGLGLSMILAYFLLKLPLIISQILPAVFLLALVVQLNILERSRELIALKAGGISPLVLVRFVIIYGLILAVCQFFFSQLAGVTGESIASRIWQEDVHGRNLDNLEVSGLWFTEGNRIIHIGTAMPARKAGMDLLVYTLDNTGVEITEILKAHTFSIEKNKWLLANGERLEPGRYSAEAFAHAELPIKQDLKAFQVLSKGGVNPANLSIWDLRDTIKRLEKSGSNVEVLRTAWHGKISYAASIIVMGLLAIMVSQITENIYKAIGISLVIVFFFHSMNTFAAAMGEKGLVAPVVGAWFTDIFFFCIGLLWLLWPAVRQRLK